MNPTPVKPTVNILDHTALSVCLMEIVAAQFPTGSPEWDALCNTRDPKTPGVVTVELHINGVAVPDPIAGLSAVIQRGLENIENRASERALEMVSKAGLDGIEDTMRKIRSTMEQADWALRDALRKKAGATFYDEENCR